MTPFGRLIREQRERRGMSLDAVANAMRAAGYTISKSRLSQLETKPLPTWPSADIIRGLCIALATPERVLTSALVESMGLDLPQMPGPDWLLLVSRGERLSPKGRERLMRQVELLIEMNEDNSK